MALAKVEIEFDDNDKISSLKINGTDLTDAATDKKINIAEGSKRLITLELACDEINVKRKGDTSSNAGSNTSTTP